MLRRGQKRDGGGSKSSDRTVPRLLFSTYFSHMIWLYGSYEVVLGVVPEIPIARAKIFDFRLIKINNAAGNLGISGRPQIPIILQTLPAHLVHFQKYPGAGLTVLDHSELDSNFNLQLNLVPSPSPTESIAVGAPSYSPRDSRASVPHWNSESAALTDSEIGA